MITDREEIKKLLEADEESAIKLCKGTPVCTYFNNGVDKVSLDKLIGCAVRVWAKTVGRGSTKFEGRLHTYNYPNTDETIVDFVEVNGVFVKPESILKIEVFEKVSSAKYMGNRTSGWAWGILNSYGR